MKSIPPFKSYWAETKSDDDTAAADVDGQHDPYVSAMLHRRQQKLCPCKQIGHFNLYTL